MFIPGSLCIGPSHVGLGLLALVRVLLFTMTQNNRADEETASVSVLDPHLSQN